MNWFDRWLSKKMKQYWNAARDEKVHDGQTIGMYSNITSNKIHAGGMRTLDKEPTMNFRLHHAENGWIVEVTNHDQRTDRHTTKLHLISSDQEFDQAICQIITLEALRG